MSKPKASNANQAKSMFVHNDDETVPQKKSKVGPSARAHIMNEYKRKEKAHGPVWLKKNSSSVDSFLDPYRRFGEQSRNSSESPIHNLSKETRVQLRHQRPPGSRVWASGQNTEGEDQETKTYLELLHHPNDGLSTIRQLQQYRQPAPGVIFLNGGADDPFSAASIRLDLWMHGLIRYFVGVCMPMLFAVQREDHDYFRHSSGVLDDAVSALSDPSHMNALLAMSAAHMEVQKGGALVSTDRRVKGSSYFKGKALNILQKRLSNNINPVDFEMMQAIMKLSAAESILGNYQEQLVHIRAWCRIVHILGGIQKLDWRIVESDITTGVKIKTGGPLIDQPVVNLNTSPFHLPDARKNIISPSSMSRLSTLGRRLLDAEATTLFQEEFIWLLKDIQPLVYMSEFVATRPQDVIPSDRSWLRISTLAIAHRLCTFPLYYPKLKPYSKFSIPWSVRIAMLLYADATLINQVPRVALVPELRQALGTSTLDTFWSPWTDILLWVLCIGLQASGDLVEQTWFLSQVVK
jgi:hypothetical protein